jgi:hypothetical protein
MAPAEDDGAVDSDAAGEPLAGVLSVGSGEGVGWVVSSPPTPPTSP